MAKTTYNVITHALTRLEAEDVIRQRLKASGYDVTQGPEQLRGKRINLGGVDMETLPLWFKNHQSEHSFTPLINTFPTEIFAWYKTWMAGLLAVTEDVLMELDVSFYLYTNYAVEIATEGRTFPTFQQCNLLFSHRSPTQKSLMSLIQAIGEIDPILSAIVKFGSNKALITANQFKKVNDKEDYVWEEWQKFMTEYGAQWRQTRYVDVVKRVSGCPLKERQMVQTLLQRLHVLYSPFNLGDQTPTQQKIRQFMNSLMSRDGQIGAKSTSDADLTTPEMALKYQTYMGRIDVIQHLVSCDLPEKLYEIQELLEKLIESMLSDNLIRRMSLLGGSRL